MSKLVFYALPRNVLPSQAESRLPDLLALVNVDALSVLSPESGLADASVGPGAVLS